MKYSRNILQIIPATGWYVVYRTDGVEDVVPLACWALVDINEGGERFRAVDGMDMSGEGADGLILCQDIGNFSHFQYGSPA